jgi:hypothetical protein
LNLLSGGGSRCPISFTSAVSSESDLGRKLFVWEAISEQ